MKIRLTLLFIFFLTLMSCHQSNDHKTVICIPVYGQSLALGEEAERITDFDSLANYAYGRIVTQNLNHNFGYFDNNDLKLLAKKAIRYQRRSFELSVYKMAEILADNTGEDTLICIFPGGQGATAVANLSKGTRPYQEFMEDIETAYKTATDRGWNFRIPAVCWMQGESDIVDYPKTNYKTILKKLWSDMNQDIRQITQQTDTIRFICYQPNPLSRAPYFKANQYICQETAVPMAFVDLLSDNDYFWASGPTYPYRWVREIVHIDADGQQRIGALAARSALGLLRNTKRFRGFIPLETTIEGNDVIVNFNIPSPPIALDTLQVRKAQNYGFSVITPQNKNIAKSSSTKGDCVIINCTESPHNCKVRYAVNGDYMKGGNLHGSRGNLRDSNGNWCYQFDIKL